MASRSVLGLLAMLKSLRDSGEEIGAALARHGIDLDRLDPSTRIDRGRELRIFSEVAPLVKDPLAGLRAGTNFNIASYGPLVMLLMTCADAYEAFQVGVRYQQLTFLYGTLRFEPGETLSAVVIEPLALPDPVFRLRIDGEMSGTHKLLMDMQATMGLDVRAERVELPYPRPSEAEAYEAHFRCPVHFGGRLGRIWLRNEYLHLRLPAADPAAHAMYRAMCDKQLLEQQSEPGNLSERVVAHLALFADKLPGSADVARTFELSERSLRRQLADEGTSFRDLVARARSSKARELLLNTRLSVEAVAQQLGYAEAAAFIHAFQRWEGCTPAAWRRRQAAGEGSVPQT